MHAKTRPVSLSLPEDIIAALDKAADDNIETRAAYVRNALLDRLRREKRIKLTREASGAVYEMAVSEVAR